MDIFRYMSHDLIVLFVSWAIAALEKYLIVDLVEIPGFTRALQLAEQWEKRTAGITTIVYH